MSRARLALALSVAAAAHAGAQSPAPGFRLFGPQGSTTTLLVDTTNTVVHTWPGRFTPGSAIYLEADGTLLRTAKVNDPPPLGGQGGGIQRIAFDGTLLWDYRYASATGWQHHDVEVLPNGNVLMIAWDRLTAAEAIAAGRNPKLLAATEWLPDAVLEVRQTGPTTGDIVWEWHFMDHVIQDFDPSQANFGVVADHPELLDINFPVRALTTGEWNHCNSISYDAVRDLILLCSPFQHEIWLIDHSTTTAEAAGHTGGNFGIGGDILYRWGNPQAYRAGTAADRKLFNPHGAYIIPPGLPGAGDVLIFNNQAGTPSGRNISAVVELQVPTSFTLPTGAAWGPTEFVWQYRDPIPTNFYSSGLSNAERLPNGNTLVCSGQQGWLFEVTDTGQKVWEYFPPGLPGTGWIFQVSYYERSLWADPQTVAAATGSTVTFDLVAGSVHAGDTYLVIGSQSGTRPGTPIGGVTIPLNVDAYTTALAGLAGGALPTFLGALDGLGNATARFPLPAIAALAGITLHHAHVVVDPTPAVTMASNAVPLEFR